MSQAKRRRVKPHKFILTAEERTAIGQWAWHERDNQLVQSVWRKVCALPLRSAPAPSPSPAQGGAGEGVADG